MRKQTVKRVLIFVELRVQAREVGVVLSEALRWNDWPT